MAVLFTARFSPDLVIYDCMDELSAFKFAPANLKEAEREIFTKSDVVFTGGVSLYNAKKTQHQNIFCFPSSIDKNHFMKARYNIKEPEDQVEIPHPRLGFFGVIDERFDIALLKEAAFQKPGWHFIVLGPVVKIDPATLPVADNIYYLGSKHYEQLPEYISGWDIALIPFALNESTRFVSPTKTPECLAGGVPVISTAIQNVVNPYGENKLVSIISTANELIEAGAEELAKENRTEWLSKVDEFLKHNSWNSTWHAMNEIVNTALAAKKNITTQKKEVHV